MKYVVCDLFVYTQVIFKFQAKKLFNQENNPTSMGCESSWSYSNTPQHSLNWSSVQLPGLLAASLSSILRFSSLNLCLWDFLAKILQIFPIPLCFRFTSSQMWFNDPNDYRNVKIWILQYIIPFVILLLHRCDKISWNIFLRTLSEKC